MSQNVAFFVGQFEIKNIFLSDSFKFAAPLLKGKGDQKFPVWGDLEIFSAYL